MTLYESIQKELIGSFAEQPNSLSKKLTASRSTPQCLCRYIYFTILRTQGISQKQINQIYGKRYFFNYNVESYSKILQDVLNKYVCWELTDEDLQPLSNYGFQLPYRNRK